MFAKVNCSKFLTSTSVKFRTPSASKQSGTKRFQSTQTDEIVLFQEQQLTNGTIGIVTLNHAKKRNALSLFMLQTLKSKFDHIQNNQNVRAIILRSSGNVFSAGHDLKEIQEHSNDEAFIQNLFRTCSQVMEGIQKLPQPVICQVNGLATAAGCQLAASCDLLIATKQAQFQTPGVKVGLFCSTPAVAVARHMNSTKKTMEMLLTGSMHGNGSHSVGEPISAQEAHHYGLVNHVTEDENQMNQLTNELVNKIIRTPSNIISLGKQGFYQQITLDTTGAYKVTEQFMCDNVKLSECKEGIDAFVQKRDPKWK